MSTSAALLWSGGVVAIAKIFLLALEARSALAQKLAQSFLLGTWFTPAAFVFFVPFLLRAAQAWQDVVLYLLGRGFCTHIPHLASYSVFCLKDPVSL